MKTGRWIEKVSLKNTNLAYKLNLIVGLFFIFPVLGFLFFAFKYDILRDSDLRLYFLGMLIFIFIGIQILKGLFDQIADISRNLSEKMQQAGFKENTGSWVNELTELTVSLNTLERRFSQNLEMLARKNNELSTLKEISELCYVTYDSDEILYITLERALALTRSDVGSILILEKPDRRGFMVKASIGHGAAVKVGDRIDFKSSIAKYAVINKSPLLVKNIETERRFGRTNRIHYDSKSFICMPIKTSSEIVGVLTISRRENQHPFEQEDVDAITALLSNAAFTYENLRLMRENDQARHQMEAVEKILKVINSSIRGSELLHAILGEVLDAIACEQAVVLLRDDHRTDLFRIEGLAAKFTTPLNKRHLYRVNGSLAGKAMKQENMLFINGLEREITETDRFLLSSSRGIRGVLAPFEINGQINGLLALSGGKNGIQSDHPNLIRWLSHTVSLAVERNRLHASVVKRNLELETIKQIGSALASSTFDTKQVLKYTMDMIRVVVNVEAGSLFLVKDDELVFAVAFNIEIGALQKFRLKLGQGIAGYVAARGEPLIVNDTRRSPHFFPDIDKVTGFTTRSVLCTPMIAQGRVIGVLEVLNKISGDFNTKDLDLLQSIASSVSIGLENARLYKETVSMAEHERGIRRMFQKFVPKQVLETIIQGAESGRSVIDELKTLTLLNIDIRSFSLLTHRLGPQKTVSLLNRFFSIMGEIVFAHNGIVDKYLGDGLLALFGAPASRTTDADNALCAALRMKAALPALNDAFSDLLDAPLQIGIAIHTGEVVVGNIGFDMKMDYTVIGDAVNEVFRLQKVTKCGVNRILISDSTRRAARSRLKLHKIETTRDLVGGLAELPLFELMGIESQTCDLIAQPPVQSDAENSQHTLTEKEADDPHVWNRLDVSVGEHKADGRKPDHVVTKDSMIMAPEHPFAVFVGSHSDIRIATSVADDLARKGWSATVSRVQPAGGRLSHRIFVGAFSNFNAAQKRVKALHQISYPHAHVVRYPYTLHLGTFPAGVGLDRFEAELRTKGVVCYRCSDADCRGQIRLVTGVFKTSDEATKSENWLREEGYWAEVVKR